MSTNLGAELLTASQMSQKNPQKFAFKGSPYPIYLTCFLCLSKHNLLKHEKTIHLKGIQRDLGKIVKACKGESGKQRRRAQRLRASFLADCWDSETSPRTIVIPTINWIITCFSWLLHQLPIVDRSVRWPNFHLPKLQRDSIQASTFHRFPSFLCGKASKYVEKRDLHQFEAPGLCKSVRKLQWSRTWNHYLSVPLLKSFACRPSNDLIGRLKSLP